MIRQQCLLVGTAPIDLLLASAARHHLANRASRLAASYRKVSPYATLAKPSNRPKPLLFGTPEIWSCCSNVHVSIRSYA